MFAAVRTYINLIVLHAEHTAAAADTYGTVVAADRTGRMTVQPVGINLKILVTVR